MVKPTLRPPPTEPEPGPTRGRRARLLRFAGKALVTLGLSALFVIALGFGAVVHVNLPASRRVASDVVSRSLGGMFHGEVKTGEIRELGPGGLVLSEASVKDEAGNTVLTLSDVRVRTDVLGLIQEVVTAEERVTVVIRHVRAERADAYVIPDAQGVPTIARALTPIPSAPKAPSAPSAPSRPVRVWLPQIELGKVYGRGTVLGLPTLEVALGGVRGSVLVTPKGAAIDVFRYGMTVRGLGGTDATGTGELHIRAPGAVWSSFNGYFGNLPLAASVFVKGKTVKATADVPKGAPEDVRALFSDWPLAQAVAAHVEVSGDLPVLQTNARFEIEETRLTATGPVRLERGLDIDLDVQGRGVDIRALWPKAPATNVDVDTSLSIFDRRGQLVVDVNGTTAATTFLGQPFPAADVSGTWDEKGFTGKATLHETGMPLKVAFTVHPEGAVDLDARARSFQIERAPRVGKLTAAKGRAEAQVKARIDKEQLDATIAADVSGFSLGDVKLARAHVTGKAKGKLSELEKLAIDAKVTGSDLTAQGQSFGKVNASAKGLVTRPKLVAKLTDEYGPEVQASATLETGPRPSVKNLDIQVKRDKAVLAGRIAQLDLDTRDVVVENLKLTGAGGELAGRMRVSKGRVELKAKGDGLDLDAISRALGLPRGVLGGKLNVDADVVAAKEGSSGRIRLALGNGSVASVGGVSLSLDATLDGEHIEGKASGVIRDIGGFGATWQTELDGNPANPASWRGTTGDAEIQLSDVQLSLLEHVLPKSWHIEKIAGTGYALLRVERLSPKDLPNLKVEIAGTRDLEVVHLPPKKGSLPVVFRGIELQMNGRANGEKGETNLAALLKDDAGLLLSAAFNPVVSFKKLVAEPEEWLSVVLEAPLDAMVTLHDRPFLQLPQPIRPESLLGSGNASAWLSGSLGDPRIKVRLDARGVKSASSPRALPIDLRANGEYELGSGRFGSNAELCVGPCPRDVAGKRNTGQRFAHLSAKGVANAFEGTWTGTAGLALEGLPLGVVPMLAEAKVAGSLHGSAAVVRTSAEEPPQLAALVELRGASADGVAIGRGNLTVRSDKRQLSAVAKLDDGRGSFTADARFGLDWSKTIPDVDRERRVVISALAKGYDAVVLSPFLRDIFSRVTGKVDGRLTATMEAKKDEAGKPAGWNVEVDGSAAVKQGVVHISTLGIEFRDVSFTARAKRAGELTHVEVRDIRGRARSETPNLIGLSPSNLYFDGVRLHHGDANAKLTDVPVLFQGVSQATASGIVFLKLEREDERMKVTVDLPSMTAKLPQASGRAVVELADNPAIDVVQPLREPTPKRAGTVLPWTIVVNLQRGVRLTRSDLSLPLVGQPIIELGEKVAVGGFIELEPGGRFQSWGKTWVIESGRVVFDTPEPTDPHLFATASWRAPEGTVVFVDVRGTLKEPKLTLTSDPARPEAEIMALLFGGSSTGASDESATARTRETAAAGGFATLFNQLFADALVGSVELRAGTDENKASYTAAVRISETVWFEGTYRNRLEQQQNTTSTEPVDVSGTIDWRFRRNWSLRTEAGTLGTGVDLLWQYRY